MRVASATTKRSSSSTQNISASTYCVTLRFTARTHTHLPYTRDNRMRRLFWKQ